MNNREFFPTGKKRKSEINAKKEASVLLKNEGKKLIKESEHYTWIDSPLDGTSSIETPFVNSFERVLPYPEKSLRNYIETVLKKRKGQAIGVEFGGTGLKLFRGFTPKFFEKSVGVTLIDHRDEDELEPYVKKEHEINHEVLEGDIFSDETYEHLNRLLDNQKVDLIIERMAKGLEFVPAEPYTVSKILQIWYCLLHEGGIMLVQTPVVFNNLLIAWRDKIEQEFKGKIEIIFKKRKYRQ